MRRMIVSVVVMVIGWGKGGWGTTKVEIDGREMKVNGERFVMKGMCYTPTAIGSAPDYKYDYYTAEDKRVWTKDVDRMRAMGVNTVRIFGWDADADHSEFMDYCYNDGDDPIYLMVQFYIPTYYDLWWEVPRNETQYGDREGRGGATD